MTQRNPLCLDTALGLYRAIRAASGDTIDPALLGRLQQVTETTVDLGTLTANAVLDFSAGTVFTATIGAAISLAWTGLTPGRSCTALIHLRNPGAYAWSWTTAPAYPGNVVPTYTASGLDMLTLTTPDGSDAKMRLSLVQGYP